MTANPMARVEKVPSPGESDHGIALDAEELRKLVEGFRISPLYPIVATAVFTGARRNEILALRWADLDLANNTLRIERALEETKQGLAFKAPKTKRGVRTIAIDADLVALLSAEREKYLRMVAGVPDGASVDLSLVRLPEGALMFPSPTGADVDLTRPRDPHAVTRGFVRQARKLGFARLRFHDLRGSHETALLDNGVPVHVVAARCGHDPAVLLRNYAKTTKKAGRQRGGRAQLYLGAAVTWVQLGSTACLCSRRQCEKCLILIGRSGGTRTPNPRFWRPVL